MGIAQQSPDSTLALSDDGERERWVVPRINEDVGISDEGVIKSTWNPWRESLFLIHEITLMVGIADVQVITWLVPPPTRDSAYHTRIHKLTHSSSRKIIAAEGGFATHSQYGPPGSERRLPKSSSLSEGSVGRYESANSALGVSKQGASGIVDLLGAGKGSVEDVDGNSNLMAPRTMIPMIFTDVGEGKTWLAVRVYALPFEKEKGMATKGWLEGWRECEKGVGGFAGLKKKYHFIG